MYIYIHIFEIIWIQVLFNKGVWDMHKILGCLFVGLNGTESHSIFVHWHSNKLNQTGGWKGATIPNQNTGRSWALPWIFYPFLSIDVAKRATCQKKGKFLRLWCSPLNKENHVWIGVFKIVALPYITNPCFALHWIITLQIEKWRPDQVTRSPKTKEMFPVLPELVPMVFLLCSGARIIDHPNDQRYAVSTANSKPHIDMSLKFLEIGGQNSFLDPLNTLSKKNTHFNRTHTHTHYMTLSVWGNNIGELIDETLEIFEIHGGEVQSSSPVFFHGIDGPC